jgi:hypothetical protein
MQDGFGHGLLGRLVPSDEEMMKKFASDNNLTLALLLFWRRKL